MSSSSSLVEYLSTTHIGEKGQVTIPKQYRDALGIKAGAPFAVLRIGNGLILMPEQTRFQKLCDAIAATLEQAGITEVDLQATLPQARERVFARRYPQLLRRNSNRSQAKRKR